MSRGSGPVAGAGFGLVAQLGARLLGFLFFAQFATKMGPESFGDIGFAGGLGYLALAVVEPGLNTMLVREAGAQPDKLMGRIQQVFSLKAVCACVAWVAIVAFTIGAKYDANVVLAVACIGGATILSFVEDMVSAALSATRRLDLDPKLRLVCRALPMGAGLLAMAGTQDVGVVLVTMLVGSAAAAGYALRVARTVGLPLSWRVDPTPALRWAARQWQVAVGSGLFLASLRIDQVLASLFGISHVEIGQYNGVFKICDALTAFPGAVAGAFLPFVAANISRNPTRGPAVTEASLLSSLVVTVPIAVGGAAIGQQLLDLTYGPAFNAPTSLIVVLFMLVPVWGSCLSLSHIAMARGRAGLYASAMAVNLGVNVLGSAVLTGPIGILGAATAAIAGQGAAVGVLALGLWRSGDALISVRWGMAPLIATIPIVALVSILIERLPLPVTVAMAACAYVVGLFVLGVPARLRPWFREASP